MATAALISIDQYLASAYRPDCDYVDGELEQRNLGQFEHSDLQGELILYLRSRQHEWNIRVLPEQRLRVSPTRVRIPDVCIFGRGQRIEKVFTQPPLVCIEILSECDSLQTTRARLCDYQDFGVLEIWVFDPVARQAWTYSGTDFATAPEILTVPGTAIQLIVADLFERLN